MIVIKLHSKSAFHFGNDTSHPLLIDYYVAL
jgi:hypothetical protein